MLGPRVTVPLVAVIETEPANSGDDDTPLPTSRAAAAVIVYRPAGRAVPFKLKASVVNTSVLAPVRSAL